MAFCADVGSVRSVSPVVIRGAAPDMILCRSNLIRSTLRTHILYLRAMPLSERRWRGVKSLLEEFYEVRDIRESAIYTHFRYGFVR